MSSLFKKIHGQQSLSEVHSTVDTTAANLPWWKRMFTFFGPAYLVSVGYMDPGNWATDLAAGSRYGYTLIWVLLMSNAMAILLQSLASRLGIVAGIDLAQANRETYPKRVNFILYVLAEIAIAACDLAEVLGMAVGLHLLTGISLAWGVCITALDTFLLLILQRFGMRRMEAFIISLVAIVGIAFFIEIWMAAPVMAEVATGFIPRLPDDEALYIAIGIIGATVMPHNLYLHSALVQTRKIRKDAAGTRQAIKWNFIDSGIALNLAFFVNAAILVLAATVFFKNGKSVVEIQEAHAMLAPLLGSALASKLFAIALIAAGQSSTVTGTLAGQIVMEGYLRLRINPWMRRLITRLLAIVPAVVAILFFGDSQVDRLLILSQVVLSLQLGFAIIPLILYVSDKQKMGAFRIGVVTRTLSWSVAILLVWLNLRMVFAQTADLFHEPGAGIAKWFIIALGLFFIGLLLYITFYPLVRSRRESRAVSVHPAPAAELSLNIPRYHCIAVAVEFSERDEKLIAHAVSMGQPDTRYVLIHVVESASARMLGDESDDLETRNDQEHLGQYRAHLEGLGYSATARLGYRDRVTEIVRIVGEEHGELLVLGSHGHKGLQDWLHGETVNSVRHGLRIPVLVVNI
jgi:manganese transport protein